MSRAAPSLKLVCTILVMSGSIFVNAQQQAEIDLPELDLNTLEAETPDGILHAARAPTSFVGEIAEGRIIGISYRSDIGGPPDEHGQMDIVVHLYERGQPALAMGRLDEQGAASLQSLEGSTFEATIDLVVEDDFVTGSVGYRDEDPISFIAFPATGNAGVYWALGDEDWDVRAANWVVLPDGRQWGAMCMFGGIWVVWCTTYQF
jgi:hypothetical protein